MGEMIIRIIIWLNDHWNLIKLLILNFFSYWAALDFIWHCGKQLINKQWIIKRKPNIVIKIINKCKVHASFVNFFMIVVIDLVCYLLITHINKTESSNWTVFTLAAGLGSLIHFLSLPKNQKNISTGDVNSNKKDVTGRGNEFINLIFSISLLLALFCFLLGFVYFYFNENISFFKTIILSLIIFIIFLCILNWVLEKCALSLSVLGAMENFDYSNLILFILIIPLMLIMYEHEACSGEPNVLRDFLLEFPLFVIVILLVAFLYKIATEEFLLVASNKVNKSNLTEIKVWTIILFIMIQLIIFTSVVMYITATKGGLEWTGCDTEISYETSNVFYYVVITFTSVGYGDFHPASKPMQYIACVISLCGFLSSVFFISTLCGMFQQKEKVNMQESDRYVQTKTMSTMPDSSVNSDKSDTSGFPSEILSSLVAIGGILTAIILHQKIQEQDKPEKRKNRHTSR